MFRRPHRLGDLSHHANKLPNKRIVRNEYVTRDEASRHFSSAYDVEGVYWTNEALLRRGCRRLVSQNEQSCSVMEGGREASHRVSCYSNIIIASHTNGRHDVLGLDKATILGSIASVAMSRSG